MAVGNLILSLHFSDKIIIKGHFRMGMSNFDDKGDKY